MDLVESENRRSGEIRRHPWELARFEVVCTLLADVLKDDPDLNVLDIGCGDIFFVSRLADRYPKVSFYAVDIAFTDELINRFRKEVGIKKISLFRTLEEASVECREG